MATLSSRPYHRNGQDRSFESCFDEPFSRDWTVTQANSFPPCITWVCAEARTVAFETGSLQHHPFVHWLDRNDWARHDYPVFAEVHGDRLLWVDSVRDRALTHYTNATNEELEENDLSGDPIQYVIHHAAHLKNAEPILFESLIHRFRQFDDPDRKGGFGRWSARDLAQMMLAVPSWTVVVSQPIFVFAQAEDIAGLFGLLNDAPIQLVDTHDQDRLWTYLALGNMKGVTVSETISLDDIQQAFGRIEKEMQWLFRCEQSMPAYRVALMFRLYTDEVHVEIDKNSGRPIRVVLRRNDAATPSANDMSVMARHPEVDWIPEVKHWQYKQDILIVVLDLERILEPNNVVHCRREYSVHIPMSPGGGLHRTANRSKRLSSSQRSRRHASSHVKDRYQSFSSIHRKIVPIPHAQIRHIPWTTAGLGGVKPHTVIGFVSSRRSSA